MRESPVKHPCLSPLSSALWGRATLVNYERGEMDLN
jgi:hypothetical protein